MHTYIAQYPYNRNFLQAKYTEAKLTETIWMHTICISVLPSQVSKHQFGVGQIVQIQFMKEGPGNSTPRSQLDTTHCKA